MEKVEPHSTLWVTDAELIRRAGIPEKTARQTIAALDSDRLSGATLDVFSVEPLPPDHPFWVHRKVTVTPHNAADSVPMHVVPQIVENIRRLKSGRHLRHEVDRAKGY